MSASSATASQSNYKLPEELKAFLTLLDEPLEMSICLSCQAAILPKSLVDHLRKHHQLPAHLHKTARELAATLPPRDFEHVPKRPDGLAPIKELRVVNAYQCKHCAFIRQDVTDVRRHINKAHGVSATQGYESIHAQSWFGGRRALYWRVCTNTQVTPGELMGCVWGFYGKWPGKAPLKWPRDQLGKNDPIGRHMSI